MATGAIRSLSSRLIAASIVLCTLILVTAGLVLSEINQRAVTLGFDQRLRLYMKVLVADLATMADGATNEVGNLGEPQFQIPLSGWYWQVVRLDEEKETFTILRGSRSLYSARLPNLVSPSDPARTGDSAEGYLEGPDKRRLRAIEQLIDLGDGNRFYITVAGNAVEIDHRSRQFNLSLTVTFLLLGAALVASTILQVRFGLQPLVRLREAVTAIRRGEAERIGEQFPQEVAPLAHDLNQLVEANREIIERARMQVGNLAHALKTPLSVLVNEAVGDETPLAGKLREQAGIMKDQVQYYLDRARAAARAAAIGTMTDVDSVMAGFLRVFPKIYRDRNIVFEAVGEQGLRFRGERQDLEDMIGNLVDNAGKWASERVVISTAPVQGDPAAAPSMEILIDDDGPGLPAESRIEATRRGRRLDETKPGSGLGLSIVADLAALYHGSITLETSPLGGLRARLRLPMV